MFSEFGRVEENASQGADHGTAVPNVRDRQAVEPGLYGKHPGLKNLDATGDLKMATDFRRVYATMIKEWMEYQDTKSILNGEYDTLGISG